MRTSMNITAMGSSAGSVAIRSASRPLCATLVASYPQRRRSAVRTCARGGAEGMVKSHHKHGGTHGAQPAPISL